MVCYKVEELRRRTGAKLQHVFLTLSSAWCISAKMSKLALRTNKKFGRNRTSISC